MDERDPARVVMQVRPWWRLGGKWPLARPSAPDGLHFVGMGPTDFVCGHCDALLARAVEVDLVAAAALKCSRCGRWNVAD